jgi:glutathione S-transferase
LFESRAIGRYLATLGSGSKLIPTDPKARVKFEQAASVEYSQFEPISGGLVKETIVKGFRGQTTDEAHVKELTVQLEDKLDALDVILSKQKYLAGDVSHSSIPYLATLMHLLQEITLADLFIIPTFALVFGDLGLGNLEKRPHVQK